MREKLSSGMKNHKQRKPNELTELTPPPSPLCLVGVRLLSVFLSWYLRFHEWLCADCPVLLPFTVFDTNLVQSSIQNLSHYVEYPHQNYACHNVSELRTGAKKILFIVYEKGCSQNISVWIFILITKSNMAKIHNKGTNVFYSVAICTLYIYFLCCWS